MFFKRIDKYLTGRLKGQCIRSLFIAVLTLVRGVSRSKFSMGHESSI